MSENGVPKSGTKEQCIYLVRHARPELPFGGGVYYGRTDYPLSDSGAEDAAALGAALSRVKFDHIYSSPMKRARRTASLIVPGRSKEVRVSKDLQEISLGDWEGRTYDEVREQWNEIFEKRGQSFSTTAPPDGECFADVQKRAVPAFDRILKNSPTGNLLVVAHGGVIWTLMCRYFSFKLDDLFFYPMDYCGVHVIVRTDGMMRLIRYNWRPRIEQ